MNKKIMFTAFIAAAMFYSSPVKAMGIPSHSIVIGNKAYALDYVLKPSNFGEISSAMASGSDVYYIVNSSTVKDLFTDNYVSSSVIDSIPLVNFKDADGEQYTSKSGSGLVHVDSKFMAQATVNVGSSANSMKRINVITAAIPDANYYRVGNLPIKRVATLSQGIITDDTADVYFYADSAGSNLVAKGTLNISSSTNTSTIPVANLQFATGNTSGNINNMGIVASSGQWIYYRGAGGDLYKVKTDGVDRTQLTSKHDARYINVVGDKIYYVHSNPATKTTPASTGIYEIKTDGSDAASIMSGTTAVGKMGNLIFSSTSALDDVIAAGDWVYYINHDDGTLHRVNVNSSSYGVDNLVSTSKYTDINIVKNYIYAVNLSDGSKIYKIDLTDAFAATKVSDVAVKHLNVVDDYMYYRNYDDNEKLYRMNLDGNENKKLCDDMVFNLNVAGDTVYYKNHSDGDRLYKIGADGTGGQQVLSPVPLNKGTKVSNDVVEYVNVIDPTIYFAPTTLGTNTSIKKDGSGRAAMN